MTKMTKKQKQTSSKLDATKTYPLDEALKLLLDSPKAKFDETVELAVRLNIDPKQADQNIRGVVVLPNGTGKKVRVAVFAKGAKADEAKKAGADIVGAEDLMDSINSGKIEFDRCIATPDMMGIVGRVAKVLGPKGLMPNPKLGTVTMDVTAAITASKAGQIEYRAESAGIIHAGIGKVSFKADKLKDNILMLISTLNRAKPSGVKGVYMRSVTLSTTMGAGVKIDLSSVAGVGGQA